MKTIYTRTWIVAFVAIIAFSMTGCTERIIGNAALRSVNTFLNGVVSDSINAAINN